MNNVNKTLYIPLYGKAYVSKKGILLNDKKAEEIWEKESFALKGKSKSKWLAYYMGMRSAIFDSWASKKAKEIEEILSERTGEVVRVRKGRPDMRYKNEYFAYMVTLGGFQAVGTYGIIHSHSKTLNGLIDK